MRPARSILAAALLLACGPAFAQEKPEVAPREPVFFLDKGRQRGTAPAAFRQFEKITNGKLRPNALPFRVQFIPVARDQLLPKLAAGYGDLAVANLTITPERRKLVDFSAPVLSDVREIVVTGPNSPAVASVDDLSGRQV